MLVTHAPLPVFALMLGGIQEALVLSLLEERHQALVRLVGRGDTAERSEIALFIPSNPLRHFHGFARNGVSLPDFAGYGIRSLPA